MIEIPITSDNINIIKHVQKSSLSTKRIKHYIYYTPHSSAMKNFLPIDFRIHLAR